MKKEYFFMGIISFMLMVIILLMIHNFEASAYVRCDGKSIFPIAQNDTVYEGKIKLDNVISFNLGRSIELHAPMTGSSVYVVFNKGCIYQRTGGWDWR